MNSYDLVIPRLVPNRIEAEVPFNCGPSGRYEESCPPQPIHIEQVSGANAPRKLSSPLPDATFCWWSGRSATNGLGVLVAYLANPDGYVPWYLGFTAEKDWSASLVKGISRSELRSFGGKASDESTS